MKKKKVHFRNGLAKALSESMDFDSETSLRIANFALNWISNMIKSKREILFTHIGTLYIRASHVPLKDRLNGKGTFTSNKRIFPRWSLGFSATPHLSYEMLSTCGFPTKEDEKDYHFIRRHDYNNYGYKNLVKKLTQEEVNGKKEKNIIK